MSLNVHTHTHTQNENHYTTIDELLGLCLAWNVCVHFNTPCKNKTWRQTRRHKDGQIEEEEESDESDSGHPLTGTAVTPLKALCRFERTAEIGRIRWPAGSCRLIYKTASVTQFFQICKSPGWEKKWQKCEGHYISSRAENKDRQTDRDMHASKMSEKKM